ncbi:MAG: hypothetical protein K8R64_02740 [Methanosarcinaceae archaeon]|nr:hypothetical protein [Methanosarcinaceae archaeon]
MSLFILSILIISLHVGTASATDVADTVDIVDIFSNGDLCEASVRFNEPASNVMFQFEMLYNGDVVGLRTLDIGTVSEGEVTGLVLWQHELEEKYYVTNMSVYVDGTVADMASYQFSHRTVALPRITIVDLSADSAKTSILLSPVSIYNPGVVDLTLKLFKDDKAVHSEAMDNVVVLQSQEIQIDLPILLESGSSYNVLLRVHSHDPDIMAANLTDFTASEDVNLIDDDLDIDDYGASISMLGMSQVPFYGQVRVVLTKDDEHVVFDDDVDVLTLNKEDTIGFIWDNVPGGDYNVNIDVITSNGIILDSYETIVRIPDPVMIETEIPRKTPGFGIISALFVLTIAGLFHRRL